MTVIAAVKDGDWGYVGSDSLCSGDVLKWAESEIPKWHVVPGVAAIGHSGDMRVSSLLVEHAAEVIGDGRVFEMVKRMRDLMASDGIAKKSADDIGAPSWRQDMLIMTRHGFFDIGSSLSIIPIKERKIWTNGSGYALALGAAHALDQELSGPGMDWETRLRVCCEAACRYDKGCGGRVTTGRIWLGEGEENVG